jgi:hypothetical protein
MIAYLQIDFNTDMLCNSRSLCKPHTADIGAQDILAKCDSSKGLRVDDRPFKALGAALIRMRAVKWQSLLGRRAYEFEYPLNNTSQ